jgi:hypothetical protein
MNIKNQKLDIKNILLLVAALSLLLTPYSSLIYARTSENAWHPKRIMDYKEYAKNQWRLPITNYGKFGLKLSGSAGGEWPRGSGNMYIFGAGIWVGALPTRHETLVSSGYDPSSGSSEFTPGCWENSTTPGNYARDFERIYVYPEDWPPNPTQFPTSMQDSFPTPLRIPLATGDTVKGHIYPIPRTTISSADAWSVYNDRDVTLHVSSKPALGVEIYQYNYSWNLPWNRDIVFFTLYVKNVSGHELKDVYLGMVCDPDIGNATDDMASIIRHKYIKNRAGTDSVFCKNVGYAWDSNFDEGWATPPGYVGFDFLQSPYAYHDGIDNDDDGVIDEGPDGIDNNNNGLIDEPAELEQLGLTSYKIFTLAAGDPRDDFAQYMAMTGHAWRPPFEYNPYDSLDVTPADKRFLQSTGPFDLPADSITTLTIAVMAAPSNPVSGVGDLYSLAVTASAAQSAYDNNWIMPSAPPSPNVTLVPGEGKITLIWDNSPENVPDKFYPYAPGLRNPFYREYDFQGYKVYKSLSGTLGDWQLLGQFDKIDGITYQDTTTVESLRTNGSDNGLSYAYIDSANIRLGFPYYYAVTSYDVNTMGYGTDTFWLSLESGMDPKAAVARTTPNNYIAPRFDTTRLVGSSKLNLTLQPKDLTNYAVKSNVYTLKFLSTLPTGTNVATKIPIYRYLVLNEAGDTMVRVQNFSVNIRNVTSPVTFHPTIFDNVITKIVQNSTDTTKLDTTITPMPVIDLGFTLKMDSIPFETFDRYVIVNGNYPPESLQIPTLTRNPGLWAYRGSDYRVVWKEKYPNGPRTAEVFDLTLQQPIPFRWMPYTPDTPDSADGWCFTSPLPPRASDTLILGRTYFFTICGSQLNFNQGRSLRILPAVNDTWIIYSTNVSASPAYSEFQITSHPMQLRVDSAATKLKVKVVPNPYLVRNEWERHPDYRKIKFINLPDECTIRIYNFAGDLIKTIIHNATKTQSPGNVPLQAGGDEDWNLLTSSGQKPAPGIYLFHVESHVGNQIGKFVIIY